MNTVAWPSQQRVISLFDHLAGLGLSGAGAIARWASASNRRIHRAARCLEELSHQAVPPRATPAPAAVYFKNRLRLRAILAFRWRSACCQVREDCNHGARTWNARAAF